MALTLFYSWQSDLPSKINRNFIEDALRKAIKRLGQNNTLQEALRDTDITLDRDTQGIPGTPPIVETIFNKIAQCDIFVPDVTFVGQSFGDKSKEGRRMPNPNVLIEYGWALRCLTHARMLPIMNTAYGEPSSTPLPFDMRHLRDPLCYCLKEDTTPEERRRIKEQLVTALEKAIALMIPSVSHAKTAGENRESAGIPSTTDPSTFLQLGEIFLNTSPVAGSDKKWYLAGGQRLFLRLIPSAPLEPPLNSATLLDFARSGNLAPLGEGTFGWSYDRNKHGVYVRSDDSGRILNFTQVFLNGELWGIDACCIDEKDLKAEELVDSGYFPWVSVKRTFEKTLSNYLKFAQETLKLRLPLTIKVGATHVEGYRMRAPSMPWGGHVVNEHITWESLITDYATEPRQILRPFFDYMWEECGLTRPAVDD